MKQNVSARLIEIGRRLSRPEEMVKLLQLCVDYGEDNVLEAAGRIKASELSVSQVPGYLTPIGVLMVVDSKIHVPVTKPQFDKYDTSVSKGAT